jgi:hypothetical protein
MSEHRGLPRRKRRTRLSGQDGRISGPISRIVPIGPIRRSAQRVFTSLGRRRYYSLASLYPNSVGSGSEIMLWWVRKLSAMT